MSKICRVFSLTKGQQNCILGHRRLHNREGVGKGRGYEEADLQALTCRECKKPLRIGDKIVSRRVKLRYVYCYECAYRLKIV